MAAWSVWRHFYCDLCHISWPGSFLLLSANHLGTTAPQFVCYPYRSTFTVWLYRYQLQKMVLHVFRFYHICDPGRIFDACLQYERRIPYCWAFDSGHTPDDLGHDTDVCSRLRFITTDRWGRKTQKGRICYSRIVHPSKPMTWRILRVQAQNFIHIPLSKKVQHRLVLDFFV